MNKGKDKHHVREEAAQERPEAGRKDEPADAAAPETRSAAPAGDRPAEQAATSAVLQDQLLRLRADFDNFRKRTLRERAEIYESAASDLMLEILPVLDHFQLGLQAAVAHKVDKVVLEGMGMVFEQLMAVLARYGLAPLDVAVGQPFDPDRCEAIGHMPSDKVAEGLVLEQARRGYMLRSRLLRPAQVLVSSGPAADKKPEAPQANGGAPGESAAEEN